jgi:hypothetical protein
LYLEIFKNYKDLWGLNGTNWRKENWKIL